MNLCSLKHFLEHKNVDMVFEEYSSNFMIKQKYWDELENFINDTYPKLELIKEKEMGQKYLITIRYKDNG